MHAPAPAQDHDLARQPGTADAARADLRCADQARVEHALAVAVLALPERAQLGHQDAQIAHHHASEQAAAEARGLALERFGVDVEAERARAALAIVLLVEPEPVEARNRLQADAADREDREASLDPRTVVLRVPARVCAALQLAGRDTPRRVLEGVRIAPVDRDVAARIRESRVERALDRIAVGLRVAVLGVEVDARIACRYTSHYALAQPCVDAERA